MFDYSLMFGLLLYFFVVKLMAKSIVQPQLATIIVVLGYFIFGLVTRGIYILSTGSAISDIISFQSIIAIVLQYLIVFFVFFKMSLNEESYVEWVLWGAIGCIALFFVFPVTFSYITNSF